MRQILDTWIQLAGKQNQTTPRTTSTTTVRATETTTIGLPEDKTTKFETITRPPGGPSGPDFSPRCADPGTQFGSDCACFEDNTAYFGNNRVVGSENPQPSRSACRRSCAEHAECAYWTWEKGTPTGPCYLKTSRDRVTHGMTAYVSGTKGCLLPEDKGQSLSWQCRADLNEALLLQVVG